MRLFYADTGLSHDLGHHANSCRLLTAAWRACAVPVRIAASRLITEPLRTELSAEPHFRIHTYWTGDGDPFCGWLTAFFQGGEQTAADLQALGPFEPDDVIYLNSIQPAQLLALAHFLRAAPKPAPLKPAPLKPGPLKPGPLKPGRPRVVAELGTGPGLDFEWRDDRLHFHPRDPRHDAKAAFYRYAAQLLPAPGAGGPFLTTFHATCSAIYSQLLRQPVHTLPLPHATPDAPRERPAPATFTIGVLGHQRADKGYHLLPALAPLLLSGPYNLRLLVHNGAPNYLAETQAAMRALAESDARITIDERIADGAAWDALLEACDVVLLPYQPQHYIAAYSAIVGEAIARAIPVVVPAGTTLARTLYDYGWPGHTFTEFDPVSIAHATFAVLAHYRAFAVRAGDAATRWRQTMGACRTVEAILALVDGGAAAPEAKQTQRKVA